MPSELASRWPMYTGERCDETQVIVKSLKSQEDRLYVNDELDERNFGFNTRTLVWDVTDLDAPVHAFDYFSDVPAIDHNLYVRGNFMYQSNYGAGLRIIDISDPENLVEVGYFDTAPDTIGCCGSWSNYPYFESGVILVTSMKEGLFVLKKKDQRLVP